MKKSKENALILVLGVGVLLELGLFFVAQIKPTVNGILLITKNGKSVYYPQAFKLMKNSLTKKIGMQDLGGRVYGEQNDNDFLGYIYCKEKPGKVDEVVQEYPRVILDQQKGIGIPK